MRRGALALIATTAVMVPSRARASFFEETMQEVQRKLNSVDRPGMPLPNNEPRLTDRKELLAPPPGEERRFRLFQDLQVRRGGTASQVLGSGLPIDMVSGVLPGTLVGVRIGGETDHGAAYFIAGGGTFTTYRHAIPSRDVDPIIVDTRNTPFAFLGVGAELHLYRALYIAGEVNWGNILDRRDGQRIMAPDPRDTVRSTAVTLRINY
jgi:hypothetical protein